jgi:Domain of unknown function (DUF4410)
MKTITKISSSTCILGLFALALFTGCASTKVSDRKELVTGPIPRPGIIWVYAFAATATDIPPNSALAGAKDLDTTPQTPQQIAEGMKLGDQIASELVAQINSMGMNSKMASLETRPQLNDIVIRGYLLTIKQGSAADRVAIGFGAGASELKTAVEGFEMTVQGLRKIGSGHVKAESGKSPGADLGVVGLIATDNPAGLIISSGAHIYGEESGSSTVAGRAKADAKEIADVLKQRFTDQGWLN